jgi:hypothetical protein
MKQITDAGYDTAEFLKGDDVYKMTTDSTPARDLAAAAQTLEATASELTTSLSKSWSDPAKGISTDADAIKAADHVNAVFGSTKQSHSRSKRCIGIKLDATSRIETSKVDQACIEATDSGSG